MRKTLAAACAVAGLSSVVLTACDRTNTEPSLFRDRLNANTGTGYVITDAKQRLVLDVENFRKAEAKAKNGEPAPGRIVCAEPSPDVAQALSAAVSFAAEAGISQVSGTSKEARLAFASSFASSVAQLGERLAVIQLLRDKMYRACEAYANGAVNQSGYTLLLGRLDKSMVTMLSAEMAAGAFGRALAHLGGSAATGGADPKVLEEAKQDVTNAAKALQDAGTKVYEEDNDNAKRTKEVNEKAKTLEEANAKLFAIEMMSARTAAASGLAAASFGSMGGSGSKDSGSGSIVSLHQTYMDDHGLEPLIDACIVAMDNVKPRVGNVGPNSIFTPTSKSQVMNQTLEKLAVEENDETRQKLYERIILNMATDGTPFAAFCAARILTDANHSGAFIKHFTALKQSLRTGVATKQEIEGLTGAVSEFSDAVTAAKEGLNDLSAKVDAIKDGQDKLAKQKNTDLCLMLLKHVDQKDVGKLANVVDKCVTLLN